LGVKQEEEDMALDLDSMTEGVVGIEELGGTSAPEQQPLTGHEPISLDAVEEALKQKYSNQLSQPNEDSIKQPESESTETKKAAQPDKKAKDAQARIRQLAQQKKEYEQKINKMNDSFLQMQSRMQEQQEEFQRKLLDLEDRRMSSRQEELEQAELARMSEPERRAREFSKDLERNATKAAKSEVSKEVAALQKQLEDLTKWQRNAVETAEKSSRQQQISNAVQGAINNHIKDKLDEDTFKSLGGGLEEMLTMYTTVYGAQPDEVAPHFVKFLDQWTTARTKKLSASAKKTVSLKDQQKLPRPGNNTSAAAGASKTPTMAVAKKLGYDNLVQYMSAKMKGLVK